MKKLLEHLKKEQINPSIIEEIKKYRQKYADTADTSQTSLRYLYYGKEIWEAAVHALLCGENLLLAGSKATGKTERVNAKVQRRAAPVSILRFL